MTFVTSDPKTDKPSNVAKLTVAKAPVPAPTKAPTTKAPVPAPKAPMPTTNLTPTGAAAQKLWQKGQAASQPVVDPNPPEAPASVDPTLVTILSWKRKFESEHEVAFMLWLGKEIQARGGDPKIKVSGNVVVNVPRPDKKPTSVLFSCHTDTVHWVKRDEAQRQHVMYDPSFGHIFLDKKDPQAGTCLGADDGAGVWIMLEMIKEKVPGCYVFHRGEEQGGVGSRALLAKEKDWLSEFDLAIAFDRPNDDEIITHQGGARCCSDKFGEALKAQFAKHGLKYKLSDRGVFTDTKVYRGVISECTNIGVGYYHQHGVDEYLDFGHLVRLRDACCKIDWESLPAERDPYAADPLPQYGGYSGRNWNRTYQGSGGRHSSTQLGFDDDGFDGVYGSDPQWDAFKRAQGEAEATRTKATTATPAPAPAPKSLGPELETWQEIEGMSIDDLETWVNEDARAAGIYLLEMAAEIAALKAKLAFLKESLR